MLLKSLEIQGFKSFPDKTKITFNTGLTAVVGPNGSGKSNISDAIRWVMGEQSTKTLRGGKMEDVIFAGTASRKPQGSATVSLSFDNTDRTLAVDSDEVTITRRYYRSGESEYLINGAQVRLKDLNELFMDTGLGRDGYAMIGQGRIAEIVGAKSKERREIFEEAAGISKYRYRRAEAERRLDQAQENLLRLYDILSELEGRVEPLRIQSEKAAEFLKLSERKKVLEVSLCLKTLEQCSAVLKEQENRLLIARGEEQRLSAEAERVEQQIQQAYERRNSWVAKSDEYRRIRENLQTRSSELKAQAAVKENELAHVRENIARTEEALKRQEQTSRQQEEAIQEREAQALQLQDKLDGLKQEAQALQQSLEELTRQGREADQALFALNERAGQLALDISRHNMTIITLQNAIQDEQERLLAGEQEIGALEAQLSSEAETMEGIDGLLREIEERKASLKNTIAGYELKLKGRQTKYDELKQRHQELDLAEKEKLQRARLLLDLEQSLEGFADSVRAVMRWQKNGSQKGIHGTVASLVSVREEYAVAMETALGGSLQHVVVADENVAKACIRRLQQEKAGRATFLPLTSVKGNLLQERGLEDCPGFVGLGAELVTCLPEYQGIIRSLLGRIVIAEDLDAAAAIAKKYGYRFRVVSLDGQQVNAGGSFTGGSASRERGILSRKNEAERLQQESQVLHEKKEELARQGSELASEIGRLRAQIEGAKSELIVAGEDAVRFSGDKKRYEMNRQQLSQRRQQLEQQKAQSTGRIEAQQKKMAEAREELALASAENEDLKEKLSAHQGRENDMTRRREELTAAISDCTVREVALQKDLETARRDADELRRQKFADRDEADRLLKQKESLQVTAEELRLSGVRLGEESEDCLRRMEEYGGKIEEARQRQTDAEAEASSLRQQAGEVSARKEKAAAELARLDEQKLAAQKDYDAVIRKLWEEYELTRSEASALAEPMEDPAAASRELSSIKGKIRAMGSVNLSAIEEYKEVSARYTFLKEQVEDASNARDELLRLIQDLTKEMERIFKENFAAINRYFGEIFRELFGGGSAELRLEDENDVLGCGIEIMVQPPGKIIKNLAALSGGEQSFVAIAIYFAILKVRPAPFCVLDEIEAALDDVNVNRYAAYLRGICQKTQFILITHRRGTMEEADVLYGVTMQEQGVSKLLELKVTELSRDSDNGNQTASQKEEA
ncbi:MAG: chromosome segregation protein SMC [Oscillospiraceae bacterium]|nr:chromosome segregation protein SMC [Oscillospiraceae bacterium]